MRGEELMRRIVPCLHKCTEPVAFRICNFYWKARNDFLFELAPELNGCITTPLHAKPASGRSEKGSKLWTGSLSQLHPWTLNNPHLNTAKRRCAYHSAQSSSSHGRVLSLFRAVGCVKSMSLLSVKPAYRFAARSNRLGKRHVLQR